MLIFLLVRANSYQCCCQHVVNNPRNDVRPNSNNDVQPNSSCPLSLFVSVPLSSFLTSSLISVYLPLFLNPSLPPSSLLPPPSSVYPQGLPEALSSSRAPCEAAGKLSRAALTVSSAAAPTEHSTAADTEGLGESQH